MSLTCRPAQPADLRDCFPLIRDRSFYSQGDLPELLEFWRHLLRERTSLSVVVEDASRPRGKKCVAFGLSIFLQEAFVQEALTRLEGPFSLQVFQRWRKDRRVFLDRKEIALGSVTGLNLASLHYGWAEDRPADTGPLQAKMLEALFQFHLGFNIKAFYFDIYTTDNKANMIKLGFRSFRDYPAPRSGAQPSPVCLAGCRRADLKPTDDLYILPLLHHTPPRMAFSDGEKDVLERAWMGETDEEIAGSIQVSLWTVKKRWQSLYSRVESVDPSIFKAADKAVSGETRKAKRRLHLLEYLKQHPEEIRPAPKPPRTRILNPRARPDKRGRIPPRTP